MDEVQVFRTRGSRVLAAVVIGVVVVLLATMTLTGDGQSLLVYGGPLLLTAVVAYATMWAPYVEISPGGLKLHNVLRTVEVAWPAVQEIDGRYGLRLRTPLGTVSAWAAPAPTGMDRARGRDSEAAAAVRRRLDSLQRAGYLDDAAIERERHPVRWHRGTALALVLAAALCVVGALLA